MAKLLLILLIGLVFEAAGVVFIMIDAALISYSEHAKAKPSPPAVGAESPLTSQ